MFKASNNALPSRDDIKTHKAILDTLNSELAKLKDDRHTLHLKLASLRDQVAQLEAEDMIISTRMETINKETVQRQAWIAPQRRLPKEMLGEIFVWHVLLHKWNSPLIVSAVCKRWRDIALSTPRLWALIRFPHNIPSDLVHLWLQRSAHAPLHIQLNGDTIPAGLIDYLKSVSCLKFRPWPALLVGHSFNKLEKLILDHEDASLEHLARDCFSAMPNLRHLHLHWYRLSRRPLTKWNWDLPPLTELHFAGKTWAWIDAVSQLTSSLECLALDIGDIATPPPASIPVNALVFPKLRYFAYGAQSRTLLINDSRRIPIVAKIIQAPNLETFEDYSVTPLGFSLPAIDNWSFLTLSHYIGQTSRELGQVKALYPHIRTISFVVDPESGVLDVAALIDEDALDKLEEMVMWLGEALKGHPMINQSLRKFEERKGMTLSLRFLDARDETPYQQCAFGFPCCRFQHVPETPALVDDEGTNGAGPMDFIDGMNGLNGSHTSSSSSSS